MRQVPKFKLFSVIMSAELSINMLIPLLSFIFFAANSPLFSQSISITRRSWLFGLCLGLYKIGGVIGCTVIPALSDQFGRKLALNCISIGLLMVSSFGFIALYLHSPILFISGFLLAGLLDTSLATGPAMIVDISHSQNRVRNMAMIQCVISLGACLGPMIGGQLANRQWIMQTAYATPFLVAAIIAITNLLIIQCCPETLIEKAVSSKISLKQIAKDYCQLLQIKHVAWLFLLLILCQMSWSSYYEFIPPTLKSIFHFTPEAVGWFVGLIAFWLIVATSVVIRPLMHFFNYPQLLWVSIGAVACGTLLSLFASENPASSLSLILLWISSIPTAMGDVIFFSLFTSFLSQLVSAHQQGKAMGFTRTIATLVWSFTAMLGSGLLAWHPNGPLFFAPVGALILLVVFCSSAQPFRFIPKQMQYLI